MISFFFKLWVTGGHASSHSPSRSETSELINENGATSGPNLQWKFHSHCATMMNSTHGILTGGDDGYTRRHSSKFFPNLNFPLNQKLTFSKNH